jgi:ppGpp synthetase/RelA/SpoT-type nucleotidyltranferase
MVVIGKTLLLIPGDVLGAPFSTDFKPRVSELQIKTVFQNAWGEADHDLGYKPTTPLTREQKKKLAFTAAQAWGADMIFDELARELIGLN